MGFLFCLKNKNMFKKITKLLILITVPIMALGYYLAYGESSFITDSPNKYSDIRGNELRTENSASGFLNEKITIKKSIDYTKGESIDVWATAYTSDPNETDDTPFITASGAYVYDGVIAANFLPIDTKVRIPELYGDKIFTVEDRMNSRYDNVNIIDIWFQSKSDALIFGKKYIEIEILKTT